MLVILHCLLLLRCCCLFTLQLFVTLLLIRCCCYDFYSALHLLRVANLLLLLRCCCSRYFVTCCFLVVDAMMFTLTLRCRCTRHSLLRCGCCWCCVAVTLLTLLMVLLLRCWCCCYDVTVVTVPVTICCSTRWCCCYCIVVVTCYVLLRDCARCLMLLFNVTLRLRLPLRWWCWCCCVVAWVPFTLRCPVYGGCPGVVPLRYPFVALRLLRCCAIAFVRCSRCCVVALRCCCLLFALRCRVVVHVVAELVESLFWSAVRRCWCHFACQFNLLLIDRCCSVVRTITLHCSPVPPAMPLRHLLFCVARTRCRCAAACYITPRSPRPFGWCLLRWYSDRIRWFGQILPPVVCSFVPWLVLLHCYAPLAYGAFLAATMRTVGLLSHSRSLPFLRGCTAKLPFYWSTFCCVRNYTVWIRCDMNFAALQPHMVLVLLWFGLYFTLLPFLRFQFIYHDLPWIPYHGITTSPFHQNGCSCSRHTHRPAFAFARFWTRCLQVPGCVATTIGALFMILYTGCNTQTTSFDLDVWLHGAV